MTRPTIGRRDFLRGALGLGAGAALAGCGFAGGDSASTTSSAAAASTAPAATAKVDGDLVYFNWADYLDPEVLKGFQKEYGVKIIETNFDSYESMLAKLGSGNQYDVVFPGAKFVDQLRQQGKLQRIDKTQLKNADQVFGGGGYFDDPWYDPKSDFSVPFTVYKTGIAYRKDKVSSMTGSWKDLWNEQAKGRIFTLDNQDEALGMAALLLGYDVNTAKPDELAKIKELLLSQKPLLRGYSSDDIKNMSGGDAWIHHMWSGDFLYTVTNEVDDPENFDFIAPKEGAPINSDAYAIPTNAAHPGTALLFIDYMLRPENAVKNITYLGYPMPVKGASGTFEALAEKVPAINVSLKDLENPTVYKNLSPEDNAARAAVWTEVKAS
ncbi:MAG: spermidine/putrescine ABC transporter substrate-binding protein [Candidatus Nanopelagicales bacterium]